MVWSVTIAYPDDTYEAHAWDRTWNEAQHEASDVCAEYTYSNGGARCARIAPTMYMLGINVPGPRAVVTIARQDLTLP